jgi:hypothetical protein
MRRLALGVALAAALLLVWGRVHAQAVHPRLHVDSVTTHVAGVPLDPSAAPAPFGPGEHMVYKVKIGIFSVGEGSMTVQGLDTVRGHLSYKATMAIKGGFGPADVDDLSTTWFSVRDLVSRRFIQRLHEVNYRSYRHYELYPDDLVWKREDNDESGPLASALPLDDISFVYFVRTLPLEVGKTYTFSRYFKADGNPVVIKVLRKEVRKEPAGTFHTIVVKPMIKTSGLFGEGGNAELYFTDDARRLLVYMHSDIPHFPGSLTLHLKSYTEGTPLNPESRAALAAAEAARDSLTDGSGS